VPNWLLAGILLVQMAMPSAPALPLRITIDAATLKGLPQRTVEATGEHSGTAQYSGVALRDLLTRAGIPSGHDVSGKAMQTIVVVGASDGYRVAFSLSELDPSFTDRVVLIADRRNGAALPQREGPYRLIVPGEKREGRWVRQVTDIEVEGAP
jgi:DMSO/TMAO reductase YedYZ molybdopterin-dependent catalytic subunit